MKAITHVVGRGAPLGLPDIDTDQIMPRQFLNRLVRDGFGEFVFYERRRDPNFVLNDPRYAGANILVAGKNFGSGSSRESAVWGLQQYGFDAVIAPSFSDIFVGNCAQSGLVPAIVPQSVIDELLELVRGNPESILTVSMENRLLSWAGREINFELDATLQRVLMLGLDDISLIRSREVAIQEYERTRPSWMPRTDVPAIRSRTHPRQ